MIGLVTLFYNFTTNVQQERHENVQNDLFPINFFQMVIALFWNFSSTTKFPAVEINEFLWHKISQTIIC